MVLGTIVLCGSVSVVAGLLGAALLVLLGAAVLLIYIKAMEEQEIIARFGEEYLAYRQQVTFIIPRLGRPARCACHPWSGAA